MTSARLRSNRSSKPEKDKSPDDSSSAVAVSYIWSRFRSVRLSRLARLGRLRNIPVVGFLVGSYGTSRRYELTCDARIAWELSSVVQRDEQTQLIHSNRLLVFGRSPHALHLP
jgi:hypothetical protein